MMSVLLETAPVTSAPALVYRLRGAAERLSLGLKASAHSQLGPIWLVGDAITMRGLLAGSVECALVLAVGVLHLPFQYMMKKGVRCL